MSLIRFALRAALAISLAALTGEAGTQEAEDGMQGHPPTRAHAPAGDLHHHDRGPPLRMAEAALRTVPERPRAGKRTELTFTLADDSGQ
jgi:hypothetical protein